MITQSEPNKTDTNEHVRRDGKNSKPSTLHNELQAME